MVDCSTEERILLYLGGDDQSNRGTVAGICDALDVGTESMASRVSVLSSLSALQEDGLIEERVSGVPGREGERNVYELTDEGDRRVTDLLDRIESEPIRVRDGEGVETVELGQVGDYLEEGGLVRALGRLSGDDVLDLSATDGERFVDREDGLATLETTLDTLAAGESRTVLVGGEAGIGKTSLVARALDEARDRGYEVVVGTCQRDADEPYRPFRVALDGTVAGDPFERGQTDVDGKDALLARRSSLFEDVTDAIETAAADAPLVCFLDDLHWADAATLDLFEHVADTVAAPVLLVGAFRLEDLPDEHALADEAWPTAETERLELPVLSRADTETLLERLLEVPAVPSSFAELIYDQTGGHPLFVTESVGTMLDEGIVEPVHDVYPEEDDPLPLPDRVEETVEFRLDVLDESGRELLGLASVLGESFPEAVLVAASDRPAPEVREYVDLLEGARVFDRVGEDRLRFTSGVVRMSIRKRLAEADVRRFNKRAAEAYHEVFDDPEERYASIAEHYRYADDPERALEYYRKAAEEAMDVFATDVATDRYEQALDLARDLGRESEVHDLLLEIGRAHYTQGEYDEALRYFEYVREQSDDDEALMKAERYTATILNSQGKFGDALDHAEAGLDFWDGTTASEDAAGLLGRKGWALKQLGEYDAARETLERQRDLADRLDGQRHLARALHGLGSLQTDVGDLDAALETYDRVIDIYEGLDERWRLAKSLVNFGIVHWRRGDLETASDAYRRALAIEQEVGDRAGANIARTNLGVLAGKRGDYGEAIEYYEEALATSREVGDLENRAIITGNLGEINMKRGEMDAASDRLRESIDRFDERGQDRSRALFRANLAQYHYLRDDFEAAHEVAATGLEIAERIGADNEIVMNREFLGDLHRVEGDIDAALESHESALETAEDLSGEALLGARWHLVRTLLADGQLERATEHAERGLEEVAGMTDPFRRLRMEATVGLCARHREDYEEAASRFDTALETARELGVRVEEARTLFYRGLLERDRDDAETACETLETVREMASDHGIDLFERRASEELATIE